MESWPLDALHRRSSILLMTGQASPLEAILVLILKDIVLGTKPSALHSIVELWKRALNETAIFPS